MKIVPATQKYSAIKIVFNVLNCRLVFLTSGNLKCQLKAMSQVEILWMFVLKIMPISLIVLQIKWNAQSQIESPFISVKQNTNILIFFI